MFKFFAERKAKLHAKEYRRGWDFAAGRILEDGSELAIAILIANVECSRAFNSYTPFDEGIEAAIERCELFTNKIDKVTEEMRKRLVNGGKNTSPTLIAWADRIDAAFKGSDDV